MRIDKHRVAILLLLGIDGTVLEWFISYLSGRIQSVKILQARSVIIQLLFGVAQGLVLRLLLFLIYILPLHHLIPSHGLKKHGYVDDAHIYLSLTTPDDPVCVKDQYSRVKECLSQIYRWTSANKRKINSG